MRGGDLAALGGVFGGEEVAGEQLLGGLYALGGFWSEHLDQHGHEAWRNLVCSEQIAGVRMEFEEVSASWPRFQEAVESVRHFCRVERWRSEGEHEEQYTKREYVCCLSSARHIFGVVHLWSHVGGGAHLLRDHGVFGSRKPEITVLENAVLSYKNVL